jgi:3-dehydroquinate dehydratase/shikimate dehydrogenase
MICVSIGRGRHRHVIAEHNHLVQQGAPLVELRLDYISGVVNVKRLLTDRPGPVVITCRRERDGGKYVGSEEERMLLLRQAIVEGADYVDLEDDIAGSVPRYGKTKRVVSLHDFRSTPNNLPEIHARLASLDADVVKVSTLAHHPHDNVRMLEMIAASKQPTVGICMGDIGTPSRLLAARFGAAFTYATFHHERALAPGQLSFQQMKDIYGYDRINRETEVFGVIGDPIGHSYSPLVHNAAFRHLGMNRVYVPFRVPAADLAEFMTDAPRLGLRGLSVTIPHKEPIMRRLTKIDGAVKTVGAVNTIVMTDGALIGYNSDYRAAMESLEEALGGSRNDQSPLAGKTLLVRGAGGAARAVAFGAKRRGANLVIAGRTAARAEQLATGVGGRAVDWSSRHGVDADVLVNCTPIGMHPNVDDTPFDEYYLRPSMVVFDTVYNPESTLLVKDARERSCRVVTGVDMFVRQAAIQFQHFTGVPAPTTVMRDALRRAIDPVKQS